MRREKIGIGSIVELSVVADTEHVRYRKGRLGGMLAVTIALVNERGEDEITFVSLFEDDKVGFVGAGDPIKSVLPNKIPQDQLQKLLEESDIFCGSVNRLKSNWDDRTTEVEVFDF